MDIVKILAIVGGLAVGQLNGETVSLFTMCTQGTDLEAKLVSSTDNVTVEILGKDWPTGRNSCEVVLESQNGRDSLSYKFKRFQVDDYGTEVMVHSKSRLIFIDRTYNKFLPPDIGVRQPATSTLRITVTRGKLAAKSLIASMEVYTRTRGASSGVTSIGGLSASVILGVTLGAVVLIFRNV